MSEQGVGAIVKIFTQMSILFGGFILLVGMSVAKDKLSKWIVSFWELKGRRSRRPVFFEIGDAEIKYQTRREN